MQVSKCCGFLAEVCVQNIWCRREGEGPAAAVGGRAGRDEAGAARNHEWHRRLVKSIGAAVGSGCSSPCPSFLWLGLVFWGRGAEGVPRNAANYSSAVAAAASQCQSAPRAQWLAGGYELQLTALGVMAGFGNNKTSIHLLVGCNWPCSGVPQHDPSEGQCLARVQQLAPSISDTCRATPQQGRADSFPAVQLQRLSVPSLDCKVVPRRQAQKYG
ncbi:hypothetical protein GGTG_13827 [Gaeumannomyces tritici R3-111a-1]|uniref:Uncharacterized protein n=1 Tax=Gaeumannomyces tritici (strain R3-111a-1) TaxID=644352 RepID=J3PJY5_GAET3|nr:hypothetical protein GGTG_13827 [Gaeumannomyces tritici R3-111a-1]EJT68605.1 hypothetical protein GGTG_13827 [Gaeumannomyces tritici R3-111a-1]